VLDCQCFGQAIGSVKRENFSADQDHLGGTGLCNPASGQSTNEQDTPNDHGKEAHG
jgi:hypothetical protein